MDGYDGIRHFALHRLKQVKKSRIVYQALPNFDEYLKKGAFGYRLGGNEIELVAEMRPEIA